jgi:hypothetical protein
MVTVSQSISLFFRFNKGFSLDITTGLQILKGIQIAILKFSFARESETYISGKDSMEKPLKMCQPIS